MLSVSSLDHTFSNVITAQHVVSSMQTMGNQSPSNENSHNRPLFLPVSPTDWRQPFFFFCHIVAHQLLGLCGWGLFDFIVDFGRFLSLKLKDAQLIKDFIFFIPVNARLSEACNLELMAVGRLDLHVEFPQAS